VAAAVAAAAVAAAAVAALLKDDFCHT